MKKHYLTAGAVLALGIATGIPVFAADNDAPNASVMGMMHGRFNGKGEGMMRPMVTGVVTAVSGNTITISGQQGIRMATSTATKTTFTVDATNAKIMKAGQTGTVSSITVGDTLFVSGTLTGTNVVATMIRDGDKMMGGDRGEKGDRGDKGGITFTGNGQPVIAGTIAAINGNTITVSNKSNSTYAVDVASATIKLRNATSSVSALTTGDQVVVQGTVNGTSVVASTVIDSGKVTSSTSEDAPKGAPKVFGGIFGFFSHLFGF